MTRDATLVADLDYVVTCDDGDTILTNASILVEHGVIQAVGPRESLQQRAEEIGATVRSGARRLAMPGLVNLHTHLSMTLLRGLAEGVDLQGFLDKVWAAEAAVMDPPTVELGARLAALEALTGGTTTTLDMYLHPQAAHTGASALGLRHVTGPIFFDGPGPDGLTWDRRLDSLTEWRAYVATAPGPVIPLAAFPHATYTTSPAHLAELREAMCDNTFGLLHTHASETTAENEEIRARYRCTPVEVLVDAGFLDSDVDVVLGHGVHLSRSDRATLAEAHAAVAHCPGSNLKLASGALNWRTCRGSGVRLGIGTDGCSSSNDLDMWQAMRQAALLARLTSGHPEAAPATEILRAATIEGARALGLGDTTGSLEVGKRADLVLIDLDAPHLTPVHDVPALLVFAAGRGDVDTVLVDGQVVVDAHRSTRVDAAELLSVCRERAAYAKTAADSES